MEDELMKRIDALLEQRPRDLREIEQSAAALQRRLRDAFRDLGLNELEPTVQIVKDAGFEVVVTFPALGRRWTDRTLVRLEDLAKRVQEEQQINQPASLFH